MQNKTEPQMIEIEVDDEIINALEQRRIDPNEATTISEQQKRILLERRC